MERELIEILKDYDGTVVFVTHDIAEAYRVCDKIIVFDGGKASEIREKDLLFKNPLSLAEAKITGCKNISKAKIINKDFIFAKEWNLKLKYQYRSNSINYIAIRSHNIKLFNNKKHNNDKDEAEAQDKRQRCRLRVGKCQRKQDVNKNRCHHTAKMHHHFAVENNVIPSGFCLLYQTRNDFQQDLPANSIRQISYQENSQECYKLI